MPELIIQRRDHSAYFEAYPVYINRKQVGRIGFAERISLELEEGRYQVHCGGLFGKEAEIWIDLKQHRKALFLSAESLAWRDRPFPKYYQCHFTETAPLQLKGEEEQGQLKAQQGRALTYAFAFLALLSLAAAWLFWQAEESGEALLNVFAFVALALIPWAYRGVLISQLKQKV